MKIIPENIRNEVNDKTRKHYINEYIKENYRITSNQRKIIVKYLENRKNEIKGNEKFGIVFVLTDKCNLNCIHCGVNAKYKKIGRGEIKNKAILQNAIIIIDKIADYINNKKYQPFLMFGGGEPSLLNEFNDIIEYASKKIGVKNIGFCTNGTILSIDDLNEIEPYVGLIEVSIDGPEEDHNYIRDPKKITGIKNPFKQTMSIVNSMIKKEDIKRKLEISAIVTNKNSKSLPLLVRSLKNIGINTLSTHRAIPVGRMAMNSEMILTKSEYLEFFIEMAQILEEENNFKWHIHHSLETIYSVLFLGEDIHNSPRLPMKSGRHSIGIDWNGYVYFDPWSVVSPFKILKGKSLLNEDTALCEILDNPESAVGIVNEITKRNLRCKQCRLPCSGGMRFNAVYNYIVNIGGKIEDSHFLAGLTEIDPACLISD